MSDPREPRGSDPMQDALKAVVLAAAFFMAVEALVYQNAIVSILPPNPDMSWASAWHSVVGNPNATPNPARYGK